MALEPKPCWLKELYPMFDIGEGSYGPLSILQWDKTTVRIGKYSSFGIGAIVFLGGEHRIDWTTQYPFPTLWPEAESITGHPASRGDVEIGSDVWIGADAKVLSGSVIGDGVIVSASSVVSGTLAPYSIWAGNPARFVRWRFEREVRSALREICWWDWPRDRIARALPDLCAAPERFVERVQKGEL